SRTYGTVSPVQGLEMELTQAVVRESELRTPYKVVQEGADTELTGTIIGFTRIPLSYNQFNYPQEQETTLVVELVWRDLRTGEVLTRPARRPGEPLPAVAPMPLLAPEGTTPGLRP